MSGDDHQGSSGGVMDGAALRMRDQGARTAGRAAAGSSVRRSVRPSVGVVMIRIQGASSAADDGDGQEHREKGRETNPTNHNMKLPNFSAAWRMVERDCGGVGSSEGLAVGG